MRSVFFIFYSALAQHPATKKLYPTKRPPDRQKKVSWSILVQVNGRLIGSELFNISTWGDAIKKGCISAQGLLSSRDLCESKWAASVKVHAPPSMRSTPSPLSFRRFCSPKAVRCTKALMTGGEQLRISPVLGVAN